MTEGFSETHLRSEVLRTSWDVLDREKDRVGEVSNKVDSYGVRKRE